MTKTILAFGEALWDIFAAGAKLGGAPFNFACRMNSLGDRGIIATRLGRGALGEEAWRGIGALGLDTTYIQWDDDHPTGTVPVTVDEKGNPDFVITPDVAYDYIEETGELLDVAGRADCVCFGTLVQRARTSRGTLARVLDASGSALKLLDVNLRKDCYSDDTIAESLGRADVLKLNEEEARHVAGLCGMESPAAPDFAPGILARFSLSCCVVTLGERGAFAASAGGEMVYVPGCRVDLVDTVGSGDAFTAGFVHRFLRGETLLACCELGNAMGAMVASQEGATGRITPPEIERFMASGGERIVDSRLEAWRRH